MKKEFVLISGAVAGVLIAMKRFFEADLTVVFPGESPMARLVGGIVGSLLLPGIFLLLWYKYRQKQFGIVFMILFVALAIIELIK